MGCVLAGCRHGDHLWDHGSGYILWLSLEAFGGLCMSVQDTHACKGHAHACACPVALSCDYHMLEGADSPRGRHLERLLLCAPKVLSCALSRGITKLAGWNLLWRPCGCLFRECWCMPSIVAVLFTAMPACLGTNQNSRTCPSTCSTLCTPRDILCSSPSL